MEHNIIELEARRMEWASKQFPTATALSSLQKCKDEIREVEELLLHEQNGGLLFVKQLTTEYADVLMTAFDSAKRTGITPEMIFEAFAEKLEINLKREWNDNGDGTYSHKKEVIPTLICEILGCNVIATDMVSIYRPLGDGIETKDVCRTHFDLLLKKKRFDFKSTPVNTITPNK